MDKKTLSRNSKLKTVNKMHIENFMLLKTSNPHITEIKQINENTNEDKYGKTTYLRLYTGFDFLENLVYIIPYIRKKHNIKSAAHLYTLLYLYPKNIFSLRDYNHIKFITFDLLKISGLEKLGLATCIYDHEVEGDKLYKLTKKGRNVVEEIYKLLAGEEQVDVSVFKKSPKSIDKKYMKHIPLSDKKFPPSKNKKSFWDKKKQG